MKVVKVARVWMRFASYLGNCEDEEHGPDAEEHVDKSSWRSCNVQGEVGYRGEGQE